MISSNFSSLPILVNSFWKIARHSGDFPYRKDFYNKRLSLVTKDMSFYCIFSKKYCLTDKFESNKNINSNLIITSKNFRIKEFCNYSFYNFFVGSFDWNNIVFKQLCFFYSCV